MSFMLSPIPLLILLSFFMSCGHFKNQKIQNEKFETLIRFISGVGEGKGRLGINQNKYLFGFDAVLKENSDWILAANIPLHGEEILLLKDLKKERLKISGTSGLELRIEQGIADYLRSQKKSPELARIFLQELRSLMRLVLHEELQLGVHCTQTTCQMGETIYQVIATDKQISIKKSLHSEYEIELVATNLTGSIFTRQSIILHSKTKTSGQLPLLSLELFWN